MSIIVQQPDSLSFAGNLKKFVVTSAVAVALQLNKGAEQILNEIYQPGAGNIVEIDLRTVIDKVLSVTLPGTNLITEQSSGFADFTATIDGTAVAFRVIKGGVLELGSMAGDFVNEHFLTWQIQDKQILQRQPEWLTVYTVAARNLKAKAYYQDNTNASMLLTALAANKLLAVDVSWASINSLFVKKNPIAWEVWFEDLAGTRLSYVQRYCLRNSDDEEKIFIWANTMGGIDSISLTGSAEDDKKLEHLIAEMGDESLQEYQTDKKREIKQSTGFLTVDESRWIEDFFYSGRRYLVGEDGAVRSIVLASSKIVGSTADDLFDYEFNYRLDSESQLLNLERSFESFPALEVPVDFFLTELLSGLPVAQYSDGVLMAVQSPFAQAWQKLSMAQLWGSALPGLVDGTTISVVNGKLQVNGVSGGVGVSKWGDLTEKPFSTLSNLFSVSPEGVLTLSNNYAAANHTHPYLSDSDARIGNWTTAYNWGDHAGKYRPILWVPAWADISNKPEWLNRMSWDGIATVVSSDLHVTGKLVVDGTIQFFGSGAGGGTGGGGASTIWELTDVDDDMKNSLYGDLPMYNGTHFARYNISNLALSGHNHTIGQVTGLQSSLDGKQPLLGYTPYYSANFVAGVNYSAPHSHPYLSDSDARIANWSTAFGWGNHAGLYRPIGYVPSWGEITSKPTWTEKMGWDGTAVTIAGDLHVTGKIISDGSMQFYGISSGGTGGGGSTTLWGLTDVADDVVNAVYGDLIMYNGTHFARINQSILAPAVHTHAISQVNGLQGALDTKMAIHTHPYLSDADSRIANWNVAYTHSQSAHYAGADVGSWAKVATIPVWNQSTTGNADTASNSGQWGGISTGFWQGNYTSGISGIIGVHTNGIAYTFSAGAAQSFLGLGSNAYNSTAYQLLENQRLSTTNSPTFAGGNFTGSLSAPNILTYRIYYDLNAYTTGYPPTYGFTHVNTPTGSFVNYLVIGGDNGGYATQIAGDAYGNGFYYRNLSDNVIKSTGSNGWNRVYDVTNLNRSDIAITASTVIMNGLFQSDSDYFFYNKNYSAFRNISAGDINGTGLVLSGRAIFKTDVWNISSDNQQRFYFSPNGVTYIKGADIIFRNNSDTALLTLTSTNTAIFGGSVGVYATNNSTYGLNVTGTAGGARTIFLAGQTGFSNGFNVSYDGTKMVYNFQNGDSTFGGNITASGNIIGLGTMQFYTASDRRLKTDFQPIINPIEKIKSLTGYFFNYTDQAMQLGGYTSRRDIGLIAQDVHNILPEATGKLWNTDFMGYKADKLIPLLVEAIKQQQNEIDQLKRQIAA